MGGLALLAASETNLSREVSYARVSGKDLTKVLAHVRVLVSRSSAWSLLVTDAALTSYPTAGFVSFYEIVEKHLHRDESEAKGGPIADALTVHLGHSRPATPVHSPTLSPDGSRLSLALETPPTPPPVRATFNRSASAPMHVEPLSEQQGQLHEHHQELHHALDRHAGRGKKRARSHHRGLLSSSESHISLPSLLHEVLHPNIDIRPVGVVESQRYMDLEDCALPSRLAAMFTLTFLSVRPEQPVNYHHSKEFK